MEAAARLFVERGYAGTTIPAIAAEADVAVETVYRSASGKAGLLADAVRAAVAGGSDRAEVPVTERPAIRRIAEEQDPVRQLELYAATQPGIWSRVGPLLRVLDAAAMCSRSSTSEASLFAAASSTRRSGPTRDQIPGCVAAYSCSCRTGSGSSAILRIAGRSVTTTSARSDPPATAARTASASRPALPLADR